MNTSLRLFLAALLVLTAFPAAAAAKTLADSLTRTEKHIFKKRRPNLPEPTDPLAEPADEKRLAEIRGEIRSYIEGFLAASEDEITPFEQGYLELKAAEAKKEDALKKFLALADAEKDKEKSKGFVKALRDMIKRDLASYDKTDGKISSDTIGSLLAKYDSKLTLDKAYEEARALLEKKTDADKPIPCKYDGKLKSKPLCVAAEVLVKIKDSGVAEADILAGGERLKKAEAAIVDRLGLYLESGGKEPQGMETGFKDRVTHAELKDYYCSAVKDRLAVPVALPAGSPETKTPALDNLKGMAKAGAASGKQFDNAQTKAPRFNQGCLNHLKAKNDPAIVPGPEHGLGINPVPEIKPDVAAKKEEEKKLPLKKMAIGAGAGAIGFGFIGFLLGGPVGAILAAAVGGAFFAGVSYLNNS